MSDVTPELQKLFDRMKHVMDADLSGERYTPSGIAAYKFATLEHMMWDFNWMHGDRCLVMGWVYRIFRRKLAPSYSTIYLKASDKEHEKQIKSLNEDMP